MKRVLFLNLMCLGIGVLVLELSLGGWMGFRAIDKINIPRNVDIELDVSHLVGASKSIRYKRDQYGLRGSYDDVSKLDIITIGGSTTDQRAIAEGKTWQDRLAGKFRNEGRELRIANAGIDGQSAYGHGMILETWLSTIPNLNAKYILGYIGINDFYGNRNDREASESFFMNSIKANSIVYHAITTLVGIYKVSYKYSLLGHQYTSFHKKKWVSKPLQGKHRLLMAKRIQNYERHLRVLTERIKKFGAKPIFVTQTTSAYKILNGQIFGIDETHFYDGVAINGVDIHHMFSILNTKLMEVCQENNGICLNLADDLPLQPSDFYDYVHPNDLGTKKIADYLYENLKNIL